MSPFPRPEPLISRGNPARQVLIDLCSCKNSSYFCGVRGQTCSRNANLGPAKLGGMHPASRRLRRNDLVARKRRRPRKLHSSEVFLQEHFVLDREAGTD